MFLADSFHGTCDSSLRIEALADFSERAFAKDATDLILGHDVCRSLQGLEKAELKYLLSFETGSNLRRGRVFSEVRGGAELKIVISRRRRLLVMCESDRIVLHGSTFTDTAVLAFFNAAMSGHKVV